MAEPVKLQWVPPMPTDQIKGKVFKTAEGLKALALVQGKQTFGKQIKALALDKNLDPFTKSAQSKVNKMLATILMEDVLEKYQNFTSDLSAKMGYPRVSNLTDKQLQDACCVLRSSLLGIRDKYDENATWHFFEGGTMQSAEICNTSMSLNDALTILGQRDNEAAGVWSSAVKGAQIVADEKYTESQTKAFVEGAKKGAAAPALSLWEMLPWWAQTGIVVIGVGYAYSLVKPFLGMKKEAE